jgi:uncharacterized membrane protein
MAGRSWLPEVILTLVIGIRFLHIVTAIIFVGGIFARQAVRTLIPRASSVEAIVTLSQAAGKIERMMVIPGNLLVIVFGLILALETRMPVLGVIQGASQNWLLASIVILVLLLPLVPLVFLPRGKVFEAALQDGLAKGEITPALREQLADPVVRWAHTLELVGVGLIVALMVFRPF